MDDVHDVLTEDEINDLLDGDRDAGWPSLSPPRRLELTGPSGPSAAAGPDRCGCAGTARRRKRAPKGAAPGDIAATAVCDLPATAGGCQRAGSQVSVTGLLLPSAA